MNPKTKIHLNIAIYEVIMFGSVFALGLLDLGVIPFLYLCVAAGLSYSAIINTVTKHRIKPYWYKWFKEPQPNFKV